MQSRIVIRNFQGGNMKKVAVILSGCGFKDGSEITEAVSSFIALGQNSCSYQVYSLNKEVASINHLTDEEGEPRNLLVESARIARGAVEDIKKLNADEFDALLLPGGFGAALYLCDFAKRGSQCEVDADVKAIIDKFYVSSKPIGALCIAPALVACVLGKHGVELTIGCDQSTATEIEKTGARHVECRVDDYVTDRGNKIITSPAYMYDDAKPSEVYKGVLGAITELALMA